MNDHKSHGILENDKRLKEIKNTFSRAYSENQKGIDFDLFSNSINQSVLLTKGLRGELVIPDFNGFCKQIIDIYNQVEGNMGGAVADYIPQLARVNPKQFAVSICTVDGQRFDYGDSDRNFCLQSTCKPINYCIAQEELGEDFVQNHIVVSLYRHLMSRMLHLF